jgi:hypothetical protein
MAIISARASARASALVAVIVQPFHVVYKQVGHIIFSIDIYE